jgi:hypothetical protein
MIRNCKICGKQFHTWPSEVKEGFGKYCSHLCAGADHPNKRPALFSTCKLCGKQFKVIPYELKRKRGIYCSRKCLSDYVHLFGMS